MVAIIEQVDRLGRRSGLVSATVGMIIVFLLLLGGSSDLDKSPSDNWIYILLTWGMEIWLSILIPIVAVLVSSYATGLLVAKKALLGFGNAFVWALLAAYIDLLVGLSSLSICGYLKDTLSGNGLTNGIDDFALLVYFSAIYAFIPIAVVAVLRALWLRKRLDHERVLW